MIVPDNSSFLLMFGPNTHTSATFKLASAYCIQTYDLPSRDRLDKRKFNRTWYPYRFFKFVCVRATNHPP